MSETSPLLANNSPRRIRMSPQLLWKTGAIFGGLKTLPMYVA